jgi:predicted transposase YbfD/YdcC
MYLSIFASGEPGAGEALTIDPASLYSAFEQVKDGRKKKGKRYPLPLLLTLLMLGKLAGETTVNGIVDWIKERQGWLRAQLNWPKRFPTNSTYSEALARCDAQQLVTVIASVLLKARAVEQGGGEPCRLQAQKQEEPLTQVAMDGKTLRGTLGHESQRQPSVHLLSLYECQSGIVLTQRAVQSKENEISAAAALVHPALVKGRILSTDAMHTQKKWCACVHVYEGYYLTIVKKNQPQMYEDLVDFFEDPDAEQEEWQYSQSVQKKHGRLEIRELWVSTQMNEWFETEWAGVAQVFRVRRYVKEGEHEREEIVYGITNLRRQESPCLSPACPPASSLADRKSSPLPPRCHLRGRCLPGPHSRCSSRVGGPQWRRLGFDGLASRSQCGFCHAPFLCPSRPSPAVTVWQALAVERVHQKALSRVHLHLTFSGLICILPLWGRQKHSPFPTRLRVLKLVGHLPFPSGSSGSCSSLALGRSSSFGIST